MNTAEPISMTPEAIKKYIDEVFRAYVGEEMAFGHAVEHLIGLVACSDPDFPGYGSPRMSVGYFISNYTTEKRRRGCAAEEVGHLSDLTEEDIDDLVVYVAEHEYFETVCRVFRIMSME